MIRTVAAVSAFHQYSVRGTYSIRTVYSSTTVRTVMQYDTCTAGAESVQYEWAYSKERDKQGDCVMCVQY